MTLTAGLHLTQFLDFSFEILLESFVDWTLRVSLSLLVYWDARENISPVVNLPLGHKLSFLCWPNRFGIFNLLFFLVPEH